MYTELGWKQEPKLQRKLEQEPKEIVSAPQHLSHVWRLRDHKTGKDLLTRLPEN
jgi:hypothetical protein